MENTYVAGPTPEYPNMPPVHPFPVPQAFNGPSPDAKPHYSRQQVKEMRLLERAGVPFWLHRTGMEATVRALSFADKIMMSGIPLGLQQEISAAINDANARQGQRLRSFAEMLQTASNDERFANALCLAGFISPRLVATEAELDGSDDCWLVTDLHIDERLRYMKMVQGGGAEEDISRIARFLRARLEAPATG